MIRKRFGDKKQSAASSAWTTFEFQQQQSAASNYDFLSPKKAKVSRRTSEDENDVFARPLIDMILPQPKSQSVFYATTKTKSTSKSKGSARIKRGKGV